MKKDQQPKSLKLSDRFLTQKQINGSLLESEGLITHLIVTTPAKNLKLVSAIDPGYRNIGVAISNGSRSISCVQITVPTHDNEIERLWGIHTLVDGWLSRLTFDTSVRYTSIAIEQAAYSRGKGQAPLSHARAACIFAASKWGTPELVPISTARRVVFGNGKIKGKDVWGDDIGPDAADALVLLTYLIERKSQ